MSKHLVRLQQELGNLEEWYFTGEVTYHPEESLDDWLCVCGARIQYAHQIKHTGTGEVVTVGSECIRHFRVSPEARLRNRYPSKARNSAYCNYLQDKRA